jgi:hypothetical protein
MVLSFAELRWQSFQLMDVTQLIEITQQNSVDISDFGRVSDNLFPICLVFP